MIRKLFPNYVIRFFLKLGILVLLFTLCRVLFLIYNNDHFPVVYFTDFLAGFWFDLVSAAIVFLPLVLLELLPNKWRGNKWFQLALAICFHVIVFLSVFINLIDVEYFRHTATRSTYGLVVMLSAGNDLGVQLPSLISSYWYFILYSAVFQTGAWYFYKRVNRIKDDSHAASWVKQIIWYPIGVAILVLIGRGGVGMKPIGPPNAAGYTIDQNVQLVLNSAFTMIKSWGGVTLEEKEYFEEEELKDIYTTRRHFNSPARLEQPNICLITLESFSAEYVSEVNGTDQVYTPFLDSLARESLVFTRCYANGKKSVDAVPALISSIPKLMEIEYLASTYATNTIESLPKILHDKGYSSGFFHGAENGSMNFDMFADVAGFNDYYGKQEYNNDEHYDGTWGIYDEEFLSWSADKFDKMPEPFFNTIFTVSSHPPYAIPERYKERFTGGPTEMHNSIAYADYSLQQFFKKAKKMSWYENTLFIIVADHTPASSEPLYQKDIGQMHIPLIFYHPTDSTFRGKSEKIVSQTDVMPTVLEIIGHDEPFFSFGQSVFSDDPGYSASMIGNRFLYFGQIKGLNYLLMFENEETIAIYAVDDMAQQTNLIDKERLLVLEDRLKAMIQTYNHALITNKMTIE